MPSREAVSSIASGPTRSASWAKYALHEWTMPLVHVDRAVRVSVQHVVPDRSAPAGNLRAHTAVRQPRAHERLSAPLVALSKRRGGGHELERRTRWIEAVAGAVEQRRAVLLHCAAIVVRSRPGITRRGEHLTRFGVEDDSRCLGAPRPLRMAGQDRGDTLLQTRIQCCVQIAVAGQQSFDVRMVRTVPMTE